MNRILRNPLRFMLGPLLGWSIPFAQQGVVVDQSTGRPLANAWVMHRPSWALAMTDNQGSFAFPDVLPIRAPSQSPWAAGPLSVSPEGRLRLSPGMAHPVEVRAQGTRHPLPKVGSDAYRLPVSRPGLITLLVGRTVYRGVLLGHGGSLAPVGALSRPAATSALARRVASPESLTVSRYGYDPTSLVLTSRDVGEVRLSPNPEAPPPGMRKLNGGAFKMGSNRDPVESPIHDVTVSAFYVDTTEVTQADYELLMGETPWKRDARGYDLTFASRQPALQMTWFEAALYCNKRSKRDGLDTVFTYSGRSPEPKYGIFILNDLTVNIHAKGYRLPTEAEWEYACKGGQDSIYHWGTNIDLGDSARLYGWFNRNVHHTGNSITNEPVGLKGQNRFGLFDIVGNAVEYVLDSRTAPFPQVPNENPFFEDSEQPPSRMDKGGGFLFPSRDMACSSRGSINAYGFGTASGFRVVLPIR